MPAYIRPLRDANNNIIYPPTKANAVYLSDNTTTVEEALQNTGEGLEIYTCTIGTNWSGSSAPYTQTISVPGILASDVPIVDYMPTGNYATDSAAEEAFMSGIHRVTTANGSITVYFHEQSEVSIPIRLYVVR